MRVEHKKNPPTRYGNVREVPASSFARCSRCGKHAQKRIHNAYRSSTVCDDKECREREQNWVGNLPFSPIVANGSWATEKKRAADDRTFKVKKAGAL
jgi:hypothetical protein